MTVNIFIPDNIKYVRNGYISGDFISSVVVNSEENEKITTVFIDSEIKDMASCDSIGVILPYNGPSITKKFHSLWIALRTVPTILVCSILVNGKAVSVEDINVIFYNFEKLSSSVMLTYKNGENFDSSSSVAYFIEKIKEKQKLSEHLKIHYHYFNISEVVTWCVNLSSYLKRLFSFIYNIFMSKFGIKSYFFHQLFLRFCHIQKFMEIFSQKQNILAIRVAGIIFIDMILGILFLSIVYEATLPSELHSEFQYATQILAGIVQNLLEWLKGAPAGLKLNQPLSEALSSFFSYHVYLWTIYIDVAVPVLSVLAHIFVYVGVFGISFQIALLSDFLNLAVLHIHCFYIYAARLHMVQVSLFGSQWRGFRGSKWNPLKQRIDARVEARQKPTVKILSAVGFTFVVFLLPTTTVYYAVFTTLRLFLLSLQGVFSLCLWAVNSNPFSIVCLHLLGSSSLKGELHFEIESVPNQRYRTPCYLALRLGVWSSPLFKVISACHDDEAFPPLPRPDVRKMLLSLIYARELI